MKKINIKYCLIFLITLPIVLVLMYFYIKNHTTVLWNKYEREDIGFSIKYPEEVRAMYMKEDLAHNLINTEDCYILLGEDYYVYLKFDLNSKGCSINYSNPGYDDLNYTNIIIDDKKYRVAKFTRKDVPNLFNNDFIMKGVSVNYGVGFDVDLTDEEFELAKKKVQQIIATIKLVNKES